MIGKAVSIGSSFTSGTVGNDDTGQYVARELVGDTQVTTFPWDDIYPPYLQSVDNLNMASDIPCINGLIRAGVDFSDYVNPTSIPEWLAKDSAVWAKIKYNLSDNYDGTTPGGNSLIRSAQAGYDATCCHSFIATKLNDGRYAYGYTWRSGNTSQNPYFTGAVANPKDDVPFSVPPKFARTHFCIDGGSPIGLNLPLPPLKDNFWYTPNVEFETDPRLVWVTPNGFAAAVYQDTQGNLWLTAAGFRFVIDKAVNNHQRYVDMLDLLENMP